MQDIIQQIGVGQLYLKQTYFASKDFKNLTISDFSPIKTLKNSQVNFTYTGIYRGKTVSYSLNALTELDIFYEEMEMVKENIQTIFSFPYIDTVDYDLVHLLHKFYSSLFYVGVKRIRQGITYVDFDEHLFHHYEDFNLLQKYNPEAVEA